MYILLYIFGKGRKGRARTKAFAAFKLLSRHLDGPDDGHRGRDRQVLSEPGQGSGSGQCLVWSCLGRC